MAGSKKINKKTLVLIDAHAVLHRAYHAVPSFTSATTGEPTGALYGFVSTFLKTVKEFKPDYMAVCYDLPQPTFRHQFYEKYKAKRPEVEGELSFQIMQSKKFLEAAGVPWYDSPGFEADDVLSTFVFRLKKEKAEPLKIIIVTGDLDTLQLIGPDVEVYTMKRGIKDSIMYDEKAVFERFGFGPELVPDFKGLMGDPSDNIPGVKGIGEKTAKEIIQKFGSLKNIYEKIKKDEDLFEKAGVKARTIKLLKENEEEAMFSRALAETRTDVPIVFTLKGLIWRDNFSLKKVEAFLREKGFRTLLNRLSLEIGAGEETKQEYLGNLKEEDEQFLKIAYWLLDSRRANPQLAEIFSYLEIESLEEAKNKLEKQIKENGLDRVFHNVELPLTEILKDMEKHGVLLDVNYLKEISKTCHKDLKNLEKKIWKLAGEEFNINSPKQLAEVLFIKMGISTKGVQKTSGGALSTRFSELLKIKERHPVIEELFLYRELSKLVSTYIDALPNLVDKENRLHTSFNQTGTTTGRLSSSEPNLQNIPTRTDFGRSVRRAFTVPAGWSLVSFDYSQIELRVAASLSGDKKMTNAFLNNEDIHTKVASEVFNVPFDKVDKEMRRRAKVINFGIIYGMGVNSLRKNLNCSKEEAEIFYNEYFNDFLGVARYLEEIKRNARKDGFTTTFFGRRRYLPEINSPVEFIKKEAERMAINAPIQGTAADIIKIAMVNIDKFLKKEFKEKARMILQVHDELLFEVKNDILKEVFSPIKKIMEDVELPKVPILVDISSGANWAEMEK